MAHLNLALAVIVIESKNSLAEIALELPENERYVVNSVVEDVSTQYSAASRESTPFVAPSMATCALLLTHKPFDPFTGWVFGSDEERCDFLLTTTNKETGVSGRHFGINYNWTSRYLRLTNLSRHHTMMSSPKLGQDIIVRDSRVIPSGEEVTITAGRVTLVIRVPVRGDYQDTFSRALDAYHNEVKEAMPRLATLGFGEPLHETPQVVLGKRNRVQYLIEKEGDIGEGHFGTVSKALDPITGDLYAAKRLRKASQSAHHEIELHQRLSHVSLLFAHCYSSDDYQKHIVRFIDIQEDPSSPLLIMEYLPCGNLAQQTGFTFSETVTMLEQQLHAVAYLHGMKITHRDIKPENILLESRSPCLITKLSDFGLSSGKTWLKTFCGTGLYLAPEVVKKGPVYSNAVDIWSLGTVGLQSVYGFPLMLRKWNAQAWIDAVYYHARKQRGMLAAFLQKMLSLRPAKRPSAEECLDSWDSIASLTALTQNETPPTKIPEERPQRLMDHQKPHVPQVYGVRAPPRRPLFGAISSECDLEARIKGLGDFLLYDESNGEVKTKRKKRNDGKAKPKMMAINKESKEDAAEITDDEEAETFRLERKGTSPEDQIQNDSQKPWASVTGSSPSPNQATYNPLSTREMEKEELLKWMKTTLETGASSSRRSTEVC